MSVKSPKSARTRRLALAGTAVGVVVALVVALLIAKFVGGDTPAASAAPGGDAAPILAAISRLPASGYDTVGAGSTSNQPQALTSPTALTADGKPEVLYVGAEFCPFCASVTWGLVTALNRFGTFTTLDLTSSASDDVYPNTATFTFHKSVYTSTYITFRGYELSDRAHKQLDTMPSAETKVFQTFDQPPYAEAASAGSIPFLAIGGHYLLHGATYDPQLLHGLTQRQIAAHLNNPDDPIAQAIFAEANLLSAAICQSTGGKPASVCSSAGVKAAAATLAASG